MSNVFAFLAGSKHKEFQVATMANSTELQQSETAVTHWNTTAEPSHGVVVIDALLDAPLILFASRF